MSRWAHASPRGQRTEATRSRWRWFGRVVAACTIAVALALVPAEIFGGRSSLHINKLRAQLGTTETRLTELRQLNLALQREIALLRSNPQAIEEIARDELGLVRPGELMLRIDDLSRGTR